MFVRLCSIFITFSFLLFYFVLSTTGKDLQPPAIDLQLDQEAMKKLWKELEKPLDSLNPTNEAKNKTCNLIAFTEAKGTITSPNFPLADYSDNINCFYVIHVEEGHKIKLVFTAFSTEQDSDYVTVYDGFSVNDTILLQASGSKTTAMLDTVVTSGSKCLVTFKSDESVTSKGWKIVYSSLPLETSSTKSNSNPEIVDSAADPDFILVKSSCENTVKHKNREGMIQSPNYPNNYDNERLCMWNLTAPSDRFRIRLYFLSFETEHCCDYMTVFDGPTTASKVLVSASGTTIPEQVFTSGPHCIIRFKSDWIENASGWLIAYSLIPFDTDDKLLLKSTVTVPASFITNRATPSASFLFVEDDDYRSNSASSIISSKFLNCALLGFMLLLSFIYVT